jgi:hypothetical protein
MQPRKRLTDILHSDDRDNLTRTWDTTQAAPDLAPIPPGDYLCRCLTGELFQSRQGTLGYKMSLEIIEGDHINRRLWWDCWLTPAALPMAKRDLAKLGVTRLDQLEQPLPPGILLRCRVVLRRDDNGDERNRITRFEAAGVEAPDPFAPSEGDRAVPLGDAAEPEGPEGGPVDTSFDPGAMESGQGQTGDTQTTPADKAPTAPSTGSRGRQRRRSPDTLMLGDGSSGCGPYAEGR